MKNMVLLTILFSCILCDAFVYSEKLTQTRIKRWEKGSMNMQGNMGSGDLSNMFRGTAGVDYPDIKTIPNTNFRCEEQVYEGGLYADIETRCQVYHVCHDGRKDSFLCGKGTIFNQQILACDYWYSTECETAQNYYYVNSQIGNSVSPNNLQDNNSKYGGNQPISGNTDNRRVSNTNVNDYRHNQQQPIPGGTSDNRGLQNTGVNNYGQNQQQPIPGTGDNRRLQNTRVTDHGQNQQQPIPGNTANNRRTPNTGINPDYLRRHNQQQPIPGGTATNRGSNTDQYNRHNQQQHISGSAGNRKPTIGIATDQYNGPAQQCRCIRSVNVTPWSFPAGMKK